MTLASPQLTPPRRLASNVLAGCFGMLLLSGLFVPARGPVTHSIAIEWRPSAELAALAFLVSVIAFARPQFVARRVVAFVLAFLVAAAAFLNLVDAAVPALLGRDLNLYWDLRHMSSLVGLARDSGGSRSLWLLTAFGAGAALLTLAGAYAIWRMILLALADRRIAIGAAVLLGVILDVTAFVRTEQRPLATGFTHDLVQHAVALERGWRMPGAGNGPLPEALAAPGPPRSNLAGLKQRDVYLVYIESYGTTVFDTPEFRQALQVSLTRFETTLGNSGYTIASNRLVSPTFGGGSWLAHATLASGVRLDDPVLYSQLLASGRKLLPEYFKDAGWRAMEVMPGIKAPDPEARAWRFDREVDAADLGYHGPSFGWFAIPDQFTLARTETIRASLGSELPVFTQIVLVSSHIPFSPVPPYLADWGDCGAFATVPAAAWGEITRPPDWTALAPDYLKSLKYDFTVLGDWLSHHVPDGALVILLGDHQPPAVVGGELKQWTVPIHVLSRDRDLVARFVASGYVDGIVPTQAPPHQGMEKFLPNFLAAFDRPG